MGDKREERRVARLPQVVLDSWEEAQPCRMPAAVGKPRRHDSHGQCVCIPGMMLNSFTHQKTDLIGSSSARPCPSNGLLGSQFVLPCATKAKTFLIIIPWIRFSWDFSYL